MALKIFSQKLISNRFWILFLLIFLFAKVVQAADYYSNPASNTGNFNANGVWALTPGGAPVNFPGTSHTFYITSGDNITIAVNQTAGGIIVESGGTLTMSGNRTVTCPSVTINSGGLMALTTTRPTFTGDITNDGSITGTTARLTANTGTFTNNGTISFGAGRITRTTGSLTNSGSIIMNVTGGRFTATTGSFTNTATGTLAITGTATVTLGTGDFVNDNTSASVNFGSSAVTLTGTVSRSVGGFTTTGRFSANNTGGTITLTGNVNCNGITRNGTGGTVDMGAALTHTSTGTVILSAGTMNGGSSTINVNIVSGTAWSGAIATVFVPGTSTVNLGAAGNQTLSASGVKTFYNLTFSNSGAKTYSNGALTINNILSLEGTATSTLAPTYGASATLRYNTSSPRTAGPEWLATFAGLGGVIIDNTGAITTNGNKVFDLDVPLTINSGATLTPAAGNTFTFGGDLVNDGTWTPSDGDIVITNTRNPQNIGSFSTSGLVSMTKSAGDATFTGNINGGELTVNGAGRLFLGFGLTHIITGDWTITNGILRGNTSTLQVGGNGSTSGGNFVSNNGSVDFNGSGNQNIPAFTYNNLTTSTASTKTLLGNTSIKGVLTIDASTTLAAGANTLDLSDNGSPLVVNGTFAAGTSTVDFTGSGAQNIPALTYYNLSTSTGDIKALQGNTTVSNVLTINANTTLEAGANTLNLPANGTPLVLSGTFSAGTSTVNFNGSGAQNIVGASYYNLNTSTGDTKTLLGNTTVENILSVNPGTTLAPGANTLILSGNGTPLVISGTFSAGTSTVDFNGSGAQNIPALTYYNLNTSTGGSKTMQGLTTVTNVLTIDASSTLDAGSNTLNLSGTGTPLVVNGTFTEGTSTVDFNAAGAQNIPGLTYYNLSTSTGDTKTLQGTTTISNLLTINPSTTLNAGSAVLNLSRDGSPLIVNGAFSAGTSTVDFNGTGTQNIPAITYFNLNTSNGDTKSIMGTTTVSNVLTIDASTTLDMGEYILNLGGSGTPLVNNGTFICGTSTVNFTSASSTNIPALNYYDLNLTGGARVLADTGIIGIAGEFVTGGGGFTVTGSTVEFNGALDQTIPSFTFFGLLISGGGAKLIDSEVTVNDITIEDGAIVNLDSDGSGILNITNE
jgi:hypothetical protein